MGICSNSFVILIKSIRKLVWTSCSLISFLCMSSGSSYNWALAMSIATFCAKTGQLQVMTSFSDILYRDCIIEFKQAIRELFGGRKFG